MENENADPQAQPTAPRPAHEHEPAPLSEALRDALRAEMRRLIDGDEFVRNLPQIQQVAAAAHQLCLTLRVGDPQVMRRHGTAGWGNVGGGFLVSNNSIGSYGSDATMMPSPMPNPEQFGASMVRQIVNAIPDAAQTVADALANRPDHLVSALAKAEESGLHDVAESLRQRLLEGGTTKATPTSDAPALPTPTTNGSTTNGVSHAATAPETV